MDRYVIFIKEKFYVLFLKKFVKNLTSEIKLQSPITKILLIERKIKVI